MSQIEDAFKNLDESLYQLLCFIRGSDRIPGQGIRSYSGRDPNNDRIHEACLELERRGLIYKYRVDGDCILWMPVFPEPASPTTRPVTQKQRYGIIQGSQSNHCCFDHTIVDSANHNRIVCETIGPESALEICQALNAPTQPANVARKRELP